MFAVAGIAEIVKPFTIAVNDTVRVWFALWPITVIV